MKRKRGGEIQHQLEPPNKKRKQDEDVIEETTEFAKEMSQLMNFEREHGMTERVVASRTSSETAKYRKYEEVHSSESVSFHQRPPSPPSPPKFQPPPPPDEDEDENPKSRGGYGRGPPQQKVPPPPPPPLPPVKVTIEDLSSSLMTRDFIASLLDKPYFARVLEDTFVRYCYSQDEFTRKNLYRIGLVVGISRWTGKEKEYFVNKRRTNLCLKLRIPFEENYKKQRIDHISNSVMREDEFNFLIDHGSGPYIRKRLNTQYLRNKLESIRRTEESYRLKKEEERLHRNIVEKRFDQLPIRKLNELFMEYKIKQKIYIQEHRKLNPEIQQDMERINIVIQTRKSVKKEGESALERISRRNKEKNLQIKHQKVTESDGKLLNQQDKLIFQRKQTTSRFFNFGSNEEDDEEGKLLISEVIQKDLEKEKKRKQEAEREKKKEKEKKEKENKKSLKELHDFDLSELGSLDLGFDDIDVNL